MVKGGVKVGYGVDVYRNYIKCILSAIVVQYKEENSNDEIENLVHSALFIDDMFYMNNVIKLGMAEHENLLITDDKIFLSNFNRMSEEDLKELGYTKEMLDELKEMSEQPITDTIEFTFYANENFDIETKLKKIEEEVKGIAQSTDAEDDFSFLLDESEDMDGMEEIDELLRLEDSESEEEEEIKEGKEGDVEESDIEEDDIIYVEKGTGKVKFKTFEEYRKELKKEVEKVEGIRDDDKTMAKILGTIYGAGGSLFNTVKKKKIEKGEAT